MTAKKKTPKVENPILDMVVDVVRTVLPTVHTQMNQARLNSLQFRQAAIEAMNKSIKASMDADKQLFELVQASFPIVYQQTIRMRMSMLEVHDASIAAMNQSMEQSMKTDQQLYDSCLELLNKENQPKVAEDVEAEVEIEVNPDEVIVEVETENNN